MLHIPAAAVRDPNRLVQEYQQRNQRIYAKNNAELPPAEREQLLGQFTTDLQQFTATLPTDKSFPPQKPSTAEITRFIEQDFMPYYAFAARVDLALAEQPGNNLFKKDLDNSLSAYLKTLALNSDSRTIYLHHLCREFLRAENPQNFSEYSLSALTAEHKLKIRTDVSNYINSLKLEEKKSILAALVAERATGNILIDYYVTLLKKNRGTFHTHYFGKTRSYQQLITELNITLMAPLDGQDQKKDQQQLSEVKEDISYQKTKKPSSPPPEETKEEEEKNLNFAALLSTKKQATNNLLYSSTIF